MPKLLGLGLLGFLVVGVLGLARAADEDKPKFAIKEVMQEAHKDGLLKKVTGGTASKEDKAKLHELYTALSKNKPPKGADKRWKDKTSAMVSGAKDVVDNKADAATKLGKTVNCMACHNMHRGS